MREIRFKAVMKRHDKTMYVSESYSIDSSGLSYLFDFENNRWDRFLEMITTEERFVKLFPDDDEYLNGWSHIENIQYTGLTDKNGKEIYENDIVLWKNSDGEEVKDKVVFFMGAFRMRNMSFTLYDYMDSNIFEVIGNIYENNDLI